MLTERRMCPKHNEMEDVKITRINENTVEQEFSCGLRNKLNERQIKEKVDVSDEA